MHTREEVRATVRRAREAGHWWAALDPKERRRRILAWNAVLARRIDELAEKVERTHAASYGLGAAVFTRDKRTALRLARRLRVGAVAVNSVITFAAVASLPFAGTGDSGFGRVHGADGLREFSTAHSVARRRFRPPVNLLSFSRSGKDMALAMALVRVLHGRRRWRSGQRTE